MTPCFSFLSSNDPFFYFEKFLSDFEKFLIVQKYAFDIVTHVDV